MADTAWPGDALVRAAQQGDAEATTALVQGSHPHVRRFAHSLCASPEDAEDAAQEALIVLYRRIGMLRASGALASWMFRIVRNECLRRMRAASHRSAGADTGDAPGAGLPSAEERALARLEAQWVVDAILALPDDQRRVLIMRDIQGRSGRTTAEALGLSTAAMKSRLHRARATVRGALADPLGDGGPGERR
ncbi:sigma-70 family RNA polymerase sigma factor [Streptomyces sp. NPDC000594]|uniref:RNA polymerase sigma factor n=1 Tax=Streptomyces sp. NPDC000594 TaxID=3154261 RepID=UPI0033170586